MIARPATITLATGALLAALTWLAAAAERPADFRRADYQLVTSKAEIPVPVLDLFDSLCGGCALADIGEPYNATDYVEDDLPMRRLRAAGVNHGKWFLEYEHGGRGRHSHFVLFGLVDGKATCLWANGPPPKGCRPRAEVAAEIGVTCPW